MTQRELTQKLKTALQDIDIPTRQAHLDLTKRLANQSPRRFARQDRMGFARFLLMQIRFIGWKIWVLQDALLVAISIFLAASMGKYFADDPRYMAQLLCCLSVLVLMSALPFIQRSIRYKMHEIESATRFSSLKLLMAKLLMIGIGDVFMLGSILCVTVRKTPLSAGGAILYLLFPFLLAVSGLLFLLSHLPAARFVVGGVGLCFLLFAAFSLLSGVFPAFYQQTFSFGWAAVCLMLVSVCILQLRQIFHRCPYAEMQCV